MKYFKYLFMLAAVLCTAACEYTNHFIDEEELDADNDEISSITDMVLSGYTDWIYINLKTGETETHADASEWIYPYDGSLREAVTADEITIDWHIAAHRYEFKTNGASVLNTGETDITAVTQLPEGNYTADVVAAYENEYAADGYLLTMDMSGMMSGNIGYAHYPVINRVLCDGITRTATGSMPPTIYGTTGEVFALSWSDGSWAALQITSTYSSSGSSGYLSFKFKHYSAD